jgi:hypothetical protein
MRADFSVFSERRVINLSLTGRGAIDLYRLCQMTLDWLLGRPNAMSAMGLADD